MKRQYELMVILPLSKKDEAKDQLDQLLQKYEIDKLEEKEWGKRRMYHPINNSQDGFYLICAVEAEGRKVKEIEHVFRLDPNIERFLFIRQ